MDEFVLAIGVALISLGIGAIAGQDIGHDNGYRAGCFEGSEGKRTKVQVNGKPKCVPVSQAEELKK